MLFNLELQLQLLTSLGPPTRLLVILVMLTQVACFYLKSGAYSYSCKLRKQMKSFILTYTVLLQIIAYVGGVLFLVFAAVTLVEIVN